MDPSVSRTRVVVAERNLRGFRGVTFDAFGALLDGGPLRVPAPVERAFSGRDRADVQAAWNDALRNHLRTEPFIAYREVLRRSLLELLAPLGSSKGVDEATDETLDGFRRAMAYPEVAAVLRELERDVPLAVISNMDTKVLLEALQKNGLAFNFVITSDEEQQYKPSAALFRRASRYLGLPAANVLHVGDSYPEDVAGATAVGMASVLIQRAGGPKDPQGEAKGIVHDLVEVREFVRRSWGGA